MDCQIKFRGHLYAELENRFNFIQVRTQLPHVAFRLAPQFTLILLPMIPNK